MSLTDEAIIGQVLHARFVAGDPVVSAEIFKRYHDPLLAHLRDYRARKNLFSVDNEMIEDAAMEALEHYLTGADTYDPAKGKTLAGFLKMAAVGDLLNLFNKHRPPDGIHLVELDEADRNRQSEAGDRFADDLADQMELERRRQLVREAAESDEERIVLDLMLTGERSTRIFAAALGRSDPDDPRHAKPINKIKERLSKRLKRRYSSMRMADD